MKNFSISVLSIPVGKNNTVKILSIFLLRPGVSANEIDNEIVGVLSHEVLIDAVNIVGFEDCINQASSWFLEETVLAMRLKSFVLDFNENVRLITFDEKTGKHAAFKVDFLTELSNKIVDLEKNFLLEHIFKNNNGLIEPTNGFHYVKPSEKHVEKFIRVSNLIEQNETYKIISFWLMPYIWKKNISNLVVDTTGVLSIAVDLAYECLQRGGAKNLPLIWSHQTYDGLQQLNVVDPVNTLVLISASTSGNLYQEILNKNINKKNIATLFYIGKIIDAEMSVLCDLTFESSNNPNGYPVIKNHDGKNCPLCKKGSLAVRLVGDQFSFEPPPVKELEIVAKDLPNHDKELIDKLAGTGFFKVFKTQGIREFEIFLDVSALFPQQANLLHEYSDSFIEEIRRVWKGLLHRGLVVSLKRIVYSGYDFSKTLAEGALGHYQENQKSTIPELTKSKELSSQNMQFESAALVISACADDSHELMGINRDLRQVNPGGNVTYLSPVIRSSSLEDKKRMKNNLTYGENQANTFSLFSVLEIDLPDCPKENVWMKELNLLNEIIDWAVRESKEVPEIFEARKKLLEDSSAKGMINGLYWNSPLNNSLKIRSDFTLLKTFKGKREISQADVFVVVSTMLHKLRNRVDGTRLVYKPYERVVISPTVFERFNDAVLQASFLRAARNHELCYSNCDSQASEIMKNRIISQISNYNLADGEPLMEFLLALASGRLTLFRTHLIEICNEIKSSNLESHFKLMADFLSKEE